MEKRYAEIGILFKELGLRGDETERGEDPEVRRRGRETRMAQDVVRAAIAAEVDAVEVVRCGKCHWCLKSRFLRKDRCCCPDMPSHDVEPDGFCNYGKPRSGGSHG